MNISARVLRASASNRIPSHPFLDLRERERRDTILNTGRTMMAQFGRHAIRMADFAAAIRLSQATIRSHFCDLDNLLATILREHLMQIVTAIGTITRTTPGRARACRAAYLGATRTGLGAPTEAHLLLIRDRHLLPDDELASIEAIRDNIGEVLAGEHAELTLAMLDTPQIHPNRMEAALLALLTNPADPDTAAAQPGHAPPLPIAPFVPRLRPLRPHAPPAARPEWPSTAPWEHATPLPPHINGFPGNAIGGAPAAGSSSAGASSAGASSAGASSAGASSAGASSAGASSAGTSSAGGPRMEALGPGAPTTGVPRTGVPRTGVPRTGAPPNGSATNGFATNGSAMNGAATNGAMVTEEIRNRAQRRASS